MSGEAVVSEEHTLSPLSDELEPSLSNQSHILHRLVQVSDFPKFNVTLTYHAQPFLYVLNEQYKII